MIAVGMKGHLTFHTSRETTVLAFELLHLVVIFFMTLHGSPPDGRKFTIRAFKYKLTSVSSFQPLLLAPGGFNRLLFKNVYYLLTDGMTLHLYLIGNLKYGKRKLSNYLSRSYLKYDLPLKVAFGGNCLSDS